MTLIQYIVPQQTTKYKRAPHKNCYTKLSFKFIGIFPLTYAFVYNCHGNTFHIFFIRLQTFFSILLVFLHFLKAVFPRVPHLSAANYVVKKSLHRKKPPQTYQRAVQYALFLPLHFYISDYSFLLTSSQPFGIVLLAKNPTKH